MLTRATGLPVTHINWMCCLGIRLHYEGLARERILAAGLLSEEEIPLGRRRGHGESYRWCLRKDGTVNVTVAAERVLMRDAGFKAFLGGLLSDCRLSLVQGERDV